MLKSELKTGMKVALRSGEEMIVYRDTLCDKFDVTDILVSTDKEMPTWEILDNYTIDLKQVYIDTEEDIVKVYVPEHPCLIGGHLMDGGMIWRLIWEAEENSEIPKYIITTKESDVQGYDVGEVFELKRKQPELYNKMYIAKNGIYINISDCMALKKKEILKIGSKVKVKTNSEFTHGIRDIQKYKDIEFTITKEYDDGYYKLNDEYGLNWYIDLLKPIL